MQYTGQIPPLQLPVGDTQLVWPNPPTNDPTLQDFNVFIPDGDGCNVYLPDATLAPAVQGVQIYNAGNNSINIFKFGGGAPLIVLDAGAVYQLSLYDSSKSDGEWFTAPYVNGVANITNFTILSRDSSINVQDGLVNTSGAIVNIGVADSLTGLADPSAITAPGIMVANSIGGPVSPTYTSVTFTSDGNIVITNPDGASGAPSFALNNTLSGINQATIGNILISGGSLSTNDTTITINGSSFYPDGSLVSDIKNPGIPIAWIRFTDTTVGDSNVIATQSAYNARVDYTTTGVGGAYSISMRAAPDTNYAVLCTCGAGSVSAAPLFAQPIYSSSTTDTCNIIVTDVGGTIVTEVPNGISVIIYSIFTT